MEDRKKDHIELAFDSQTGKELIDRRFYYEPMLSPHPEGLAQTFPFGDKLLRVPLWVSSMTGGTELAGTINRNLARACREFGMGMGLGSCRAILDDNRYLPDFDMREEIGDMPFFANLGIAQVEELIDRQETGKIDRLLDRLQADGLIIHVNPLQEWFQTEGDRLKRSPYDTVKDLLDRISYPLMVKEVGQGMGYESLKALLELPLLAVEFGAFGGTNFARLELMRHPGTNTSLFEPLTRVGHDATQMTMMANRIKEEGHVRTQHLVISGGIRTFLDGYYLTGKSVIPAVYGQASGFLKYARESYDQLREYVIQQVKGLEMAYAYLKIREEE
ncbi:MAG TPA: hypothetical protein VE870_08175 [Bacteroidales bacterium]|nr:hypothetical protein [Bacteroidales bacterium]